MRIGIYGSASKTMDEIVRQTARIVGHWAAEQGHIIVTGGCGGYPYEAVLGAQEKGGQCIAYSPAVDIKQHRELYGFPTEGFTDFVFVPLEFGHQDDKQLRLKYRNIGSVRSVDAGIIIAGRIGTMNEVTLLYDFGKNIGVLQGTGGITQSAIKVLIAEAGKQSASHVVYDHDPVALVQKLASLYRP